METFARALLLALVLAPRAGASAQVDVRRVAQSMNFYSKVETSVGEGVGKKHDDDATADDSIAPASTDDLIAPAPAPAPNSPNPLPTPLMTNAAGATAGPPTPRPTLLPPGGYHDHPPPDDADGPVVVAPDGTQPGEHHPPAPSLPPMPTPEPTPFCYSCAETLQCATCYVEGGDTGQDDSNNAIGYANTAVGIATFAIGSYVFVAGRALRSCRLRFLVFLSVGRRSDFFVESSR